MHKKQVWIGELTGTHFNEVWVGIGDQGLVAVSLYDGRERFAEEVRQLTGIVPEYDPEHLVGITNQLQEYFAGERQVFDMQIDWSVMTPFQQAALKQVVAIEYGRIVTYGDIAKTLGKPNASRAVGRANATNPMPIVIPCHRVLGSDGKLQGYGGPGGLETKAWLLRLEGSWLI